MLFEKTITYSITNTFKNFMQWKFLGFSGLVGYRPRPSTLQDVAKALGLSVVDREGLGTGRGSGKSLVLIWSSTGRFNGPINSNNLLCAGLCRTLC